MERQAAALLALGPRAVLLKGGHMGGGTSPDLFLTADARIWIDAPRVATANTHGTGCTLSSAAVDAAKRYLTGALTASGRLQVGSGEGHGPVHHFHALWS